MEGYSPPPPFAFALANARAKAGTFFNFSSFLTGIRFHTSASPLPQ